MAGRNQEKLEAVRDSCAALNGVAKVLRDLDGFYLETSIVILCPRVIPGHRILSKFHVLAKQILCRLGPTPFMARAVSW